MYRSGNSARDLNAFKTKEGSTSSLDTGLFADRRGFRKNEYLPSTQAGFRSGRSIGDNSYALRTLINLAIELRTRLCVTFLDLRQACLEEALRDAGASDKSIDMFRAVYAMAKGSVRVNYRGRWHSSTSDIVNVNSTSEEACCRATAYPHCT